jgi:serine phosphatase RsbU (regulator of sigma subunit)
MLIWLGIVPLSGFLYLKKITGFVWTIITLLLLTMVYFFQELGISFSASFPGRFINLLHYINAMGAISYIVVIIFLYEKGHEFSKMELRKAHREILEKSFELETINKETVEQSEQLVAIFTQITESLRYAQRIQKALLPSIEGIETAFREIFILNRPKDIVSGDFYWFHELYLEGREIKILIAADCTGHGIPGAFMTMIANGLLNEIVISDQFWKPDEILISLDERLQGLLEVEPSELQIADGMDISIIAIDEKDNKLYFSGAKNAIYYVRNTNLLTLPATRYSIGNTLFPVKKQFESHEVVLRPGDVFYMLSDGFQDQFGQVTNKKYMRKNLRRFLETISQLPMKEQKRLLEKEFDTWKGNMMQTDDVLIVGVAF